MTQTAIYVILALCVLGLLVIAAFALAERRKELRSHAYRPARSTRLRRRGSSGDSN